MAAAKGDGIGAVKELSVSPHDSVAKDSGIVESFRDCKSPETKNYFARRADRPVRANSVYPTVDMISSYPNCIGLHNSLVNGHEPEPAVPGSCGNKLIHGIPVKVFSQTTTIEDDVVVERENLNEGVLG